MGKMVSFKRTMMSENMSFAYVGYFAVGYIKVTLRVIRCTYDFL